MRKAIVIEIEEEYWKEFKKLCIEQNISMSEKVKIFINNQANDYIVSKLKETEPEKENENIPNNQEV
jgi:hypothetical protein